MSRYRLVFLMARVTIFFTVALVLMFLSTTPKIIVVFNLTVWVFLLFQSSRLSDLFSIYYLIFGIFFIFPFLLVDDPFIFQRGIYFSSIWLSMEEAIWLQLVIFAFLAASSISMSAVDMQPINQRIEQTERYQNVLIAMLMVSFVVIFQHNVREALAIYSEGYSAVFDGTISVKKSVPVFLVEQLFLVCSIVLFRRHSFLSLMLFSIYCLSLMALGQRMPSLILLLLSWLFFFFRFRLGLRLFVYVIPMFLILPPALMVIQDLREGVFIVETLDVARYYTDIWRVVGMGLDPLKAAINYDGTHPVQVSLLAKAYQIINVIGDRIFDIQFGLYDAGFGNEFTRALAPQILVLDRTFASSSLAEAFFFGGLFGALLLAPFVVFCIKILARFIGLNSTLALTCFFVVAPRFYTSIRNEMFGWIFESAIYLSIPVLIIIFAKALSGGLKN